MNSCVLLLPLLFAAEAADLPGLTVDRENRQLIIEARVVLRHGLLECVACSEGTKEHESLIVVRARPQHIHLGLLLLGLQPGRPAHTDRDGRPIPPTGPSLEVLVAYERTDGPIRRRRRHPVSDWIRRIDSPQPVGPLHWVFAGSFTDERGRYAADDDGAVVTVVNFPSSLMDLPQLRSDADVELSWQAHTDRIPPLQTPVQLILRPITTPARLLLHMDRFGRLTFNRRRISRAQLIERLGRHHSADPQTAIIVGVPAAALVQDVQRLVGDLHEAGFTDAQIMLQTDPALQQSRAAEQMDGRQPFGAFLAAQLARYQQTLDQARAQHQAVIQQFRAGADDLSEKAALLEAYWERQQAEADAALRYLNGAEDGPAR